MKTKISILSFCLSLILLFSCSSKINENGKAKNDSLNTENNDSIREIVLSDDAAFFIQLNDKKFDLTLKIDSLFFKELAETEEGTPLNSAQVKKLIQKPLNHELNENAGMGLTCFFIVDSLKTNKIYQQYLDKIDIGMVKYSDGYFLGKSIIDEETSLLFWSITFSSYEACPFFSGTMVMGTLVYRGEISNSLLLAEEMSAGDAPVGLVRNLYSIINTNGNLVFDKFEKHTDEDENFELVEEKSETKYKFEINEGVFLLK